MVITELNDFEKLTYYIQQNKQKRVNYREIFGKSLTQIITAYKEQGFSSEEVIHKLSLQLALRGFDTAEVLKRVKISVYARFCEQNSFIKRHSYVGVRR